MKQLRSGVSRYTLGLPLLLLALLALAVPNFLAPQNLANVSGQITALLIVSLGQLLVALVAGIDLSVGSVMSLASCLVATQADPLWGITLALALGLVVGIGNGLGVAVAGIHPLIMTLATTTFLQGLAYLLLPIPGGQVAPALRQLATGDLWGLPQPLLWCALCAALVYLVLTARGWACICSRSAHRPAAPTSTACGWWPWWWRPMSAAACWRWWPASTWLRVSPRATRPWAQLSGWNRSPPWHWVACSSPVAWAASWA